MPNAFDRYALLPTSISERGGSPYIKSPRLSTTLKVTKAAGGTGGTILQAISTEECDRANDVMVLSGIKLDNYIKNPVVQWAHDPHIPAVGISRSMSVVGGTLQSETDFHGQTELSAQLFALYEGGYLKATSIGFIPLAWEDLDASVQAPIYPWSDKVRRYSSFELLEYSCCNVPMNPGAVGDGSAKSMLSGIRKALDEGVIKGTEGVLPLLIAEYMEDADVRMKQLFDTVMAQKINVNSDTQTTTNTMKTKSINKALDQAAVEDLTNQLIPAVKSAIQTILTKADLDFSTSDLAAIATNCASDVVDMLTGTTAQQPDPATVEDARNLVNSDPPSDDKARNLVNDDPSSDDKARSLVNADTNISFTDEAGALNAFLPLHQQELAVAQAALAVQLSEEAKEFFETIIADTQPEIDECTEMLNAIGVDTDTLTDPTEAESTKSIVVKAGAKLSKETRASLNEALTHSKNCVKTVKSIIRNGTVDPNAEAPQKKIEAPKAKRLSYEELMAIATKE